MTIVLDSISSHFPRVTKIILFGSRASGKYSPISDFDILAVDRTIKKPQFYRKDEFFDPQGADVVIANSPYIRHTDNKLLVRKQIVLAERIKRKQEPQR